MIRCAGLSLLLLAVFAVPALSQKQSGDQQAAIVQQSTQVVSVSAKTTTARIASPDEVVNVNGKAMKVSDVVAVLSSSNVWGPHPRILEKQNSSDAQQTPKKPKKD